MMSIHHILAHLAPATFAQAAAPAAAPAGNPMPEGTIPPDFWMPVGASTIAGPVDQMLAVINWICYIFFALVVVLMVYFAWKYRVRSNSHRFRMDGPVHNTPLELTWTIIPLLLRGHFLHGLPRLPRLHAAAEEQLRHRRHRREVGVDLQVPQRSAERRPLRARRPAGAPGDAVE
jgi:hypothetical protein